jgi:hypothetical protein
MAHSDRKVRLGREPGQLGLPRPDPIPVGATCIGGDQQPSGRRVSRPADLLPPAPQRGHRERSGVVIGPDRHPTRACAQVVDPVGDRLAQLLVGEVVHQHALGLARRLPLPPTIGIPADQLLLLGIDAYDRLGSGQMRSGLLVHIAKLRVPVRVLGALQGLVGALQRVALLLQQPPDGVIADRMTLRRKRLGQLPSGLAGPAQRAVGVAAGVGVDQRVQGRKQARLGRGPGASAHHPDGARGRQGRAARPTPAPPRRPSGATGR